MNVVTLAVKRAEDLIDTFLNKQDTAELKKSLSKLSKAELVDQLVALKTVQPKVKIQDVAYAILEDPECAWLTWDTIAALISSKVPGSSTTGDSLRWYPAEGAKLGKNIVPRKTTKAILAAVLSN